jgi:WD40 repeat protein
VWDARSGRQAAVFPDLPVGQAGFGKDGKSLLVWRNRTILSLDVASGKKNFQIDLEGEPCAGGFRVSPSGELFGLLSWTNKQSRPQEILLWESASGKLLRRVGALGGDGRPRFIQRFAFLEGGRQVLLALPGALVLVSTATGKEVRRWEGDFNGATDLAVRPDGRFAALTQGQTLRLVDLASGKDLLERPGHRDTVRRVACSLDGRVLVTGGYDETLCLWDPQSGRELRRLGGGDFPACSPALSADGRVLASRGSDEVIDIWDTRTGERTAGLALGLAHDVALSPDGLALALRHSRAAFRLADVRSGKVFFSWKEGDRPVAAMSFTPTNRLLVCAGPEVLHADPSAGKFVRRGTPLPQPDLPRPARRGRWDADYGESFAAAVSISASGRRVAYAHRGGSLVVVDLERDKILFSRLGSFEGAELALSPDGRTLAWSSGEDGVIHLVEAATGLERQELRHRPGRCKALAFSPDGKVLYSGSDDTTVLAWDLTGRLLLKAEWGKPLGPRGLQDCWASLAADATSWRASRLLIGSPAEAVPFLCGRIRPPLAADGRQVTRWLADLDRDDFDSRQKATAGLLALGPRALGVCRKALEDSPSLEVTRRLEAVVSHQAGLWADAAETTRYQRALEVLELIATAESRRALEALAKEAPGSALAGEAEEALGRLGRLK